MFYFILKKEALFGAGQIAWTERSPALQAGAYDENVWNLPPHPPRLCDIKELLLSARRQIDHWLRSVRYQPALVLWKLRFRALTSAIITRWGLFRCFVIGFSTNIGIPALEFDFMTVSCKPSGRNIWMWDCHVQRCCAVNNVSEITCYCHVKCIVYQGIQEQAATNQPSRIERRCCCRLWNPRLPCAKATHDLNAAYGLTTYFSQHNFRVAFKWTHGMRCP